MKMTILFYTALINFVAMNAHAEFQNVFQLKGLGFVAPQIDGTANVHSPQLGEIVYDYTAGGFYGYDQTSNWVSLGAGSGSSPIVPTIQRLTGSGTYTRPTSPTPL